MTNVRCQACSHEFTLPSETVWSDATCPQCGAKFRQLLKVPTNIPGGMTRAQQLMGKTPNANRPVSAIAASNAPASTSALRPDQQHPGSVGGNASSPLPGVAAASSLQPYGYQGQLTPSKSGNAEYDYLSPWGFAVVCLILTLCSAMISFGEVQGHIGGAALLREGVAGMWDDRMEAFASAATATDISHLAGGRSGAVILAVVFYLLWFNRAAKSVLSMGGEILGDSPGKTTWFQIIPILHLYTIPAYQASVFSQSCKLRGKEGTLGAALIVTNFVVYTFISVWVKVLDRETESALKGIESLQTLDALKGRWADIAEILDQYVIFHSLLGVVLVGFALMVLFSTINISRAHSMR